MDMAGTPYSAALWCCSAATLQRASGPSKAPVEERLIIVTSDRPDGDATEPLKSRLQAGRSPENDGYVIGKAQAGLPMMYGFSIAYIVPCVGVGIPNWRPSSTTLPPSQGSSSRLPRSRSSAIDAFMAGGAWLLNSMTFSIALSGSATPLARPTSKVSR